MAENPTIQAYNQFADVYDGETTGFWDQFPKSVVDQFVQGLPGKKVADIGSGPGRDALLLRDRGLEAICIDASAEMVEKTKQLGFVSVLEDMRKLKIPKGSIDGAWVYTSLIHIPKPEAARVLKKLNQALTDNGIILVGAIEGDFEGWVERPSMPGVKRYFKHYQEAELRDFVESTGFQFIYQENYQPHNTIYLNQIFRKS